MVVNHTPLCDAIVALYRSIRRGAGGEYRRVSSSSVCARGRGATVARVVASRDEEEIDGRGEGKQRKTTHALADATNDTVRARVGPGALAACDSIAAAISAAVVGETCF